MGNKRFLKGALFLSISMFATKLLGALYVIPFQRLVGEKGMALYNYAYIPYALFISLSTLGIPVGISKFIAKYNAEGAYDTSRKIFKLSLVFMGILGVIGFLALYLLAPWFARLVLGENGGTINTVEDITMAIRMISFALLIIPPMAIFRGFFQGNQDMIPTSVSQFIEQVVRIIFILIGSYYIVRIRNGSQTNAVAFSVFAAFFAGVAALAVLTYYWFKNKRKYDSLLNEVVPHQKHDVLRLFPELISYAIPFAILGLATNLFQLVDLMTFNYFMMASGVSESLSQGTLGVYSASLFKILMIPVSFAIAFGQPLIPELTQHVINGNRRGVQRILITAIQLTCFITVPAVIGISLLSNPIFYIFVSSDSPQINAIGGQIFGLGAFIGFFMAMYSITTAILQGINEQRKAIKYLGIGILIKLIGNVTLIYLFQVNGAIISTMLAYAFCISMNLMLIKKKTGFKLKMLFRRITPILVFGGIMAIVVFSITRLLNHFLVYEGSAIISTLYVGIAGVVGALVYFGLGWYFDLFESFGVRLPFLSKLKK